MFLQNKSEISGDITYLVEVTDIISQHCLVFVHFQLITTLWKSQSRFRDLALMNPATIYLDYNTKLHFLSS